MIKIKRNDIQLTRGDSAYITLTVTDGAGNPIVVGDGDTVRAQVRAAACGGQLLFGSTLSREGDAWMWHIEPADTAGADVKEYVWDAQVEYRNGDIFTFIPVSKFTVLPEVTEVTNDAGD